VLSWYKPGSHGRQLCAPDPFWNVPAEQRLHADRPIKFMKYPGSQREQVDDAVVAWYEPALH
jgi:hypothetical protein